MNAFAFGAAAMAVGLIVWIGLISGGFAFIKIVSYLNDKATDRQAFWVTFVILAAVICYLTGSTILIGTGVNP